MTERWGESYSKIFLKYADIFVPYRERQKNTLVDLIPAKSKEEFMVVELGAGDGKLAQAVLEKFPKAHYIALDSSEVMREQLKLTLARYRERVEVRDFELADEDWRIRLPADIRCVLASLVIHHLPAEGKKKLFHNLSEKLERGGAFLIADIVEPTSGEEKRQFARECEEVVRQQSLDKTGNLEAYKYFKDEEWSYYSQETPDEYDQPSLLADQLEWIKETGLESKKYWMKAGHAIFGGYKP